jgi:hypothetical protein
MDFVAFEKKDKMVEIKVKKGKKGNIGNQNE